MAVRKVYIDPGHGGSDPGCSGNGLVEKNIALAIGLKVGAHLQRCGFTVKYSRTSDVTKSLKARTDEANAWAAQGYVSIHCNAHADPAANGFEVWHTIFTSQSTGDELARSIAKWMDQLTPLANRGTKSKANDSGKDFYHVIRESAMPAVIVECAFLSNPNDAAYIGSPAGQEAIAEAIARGVCEWAGVPWVPVTSSEAGTAKLYRLKTGTFSNAAALAAAVQRVRDLFGWTVYEWAEGAYSAGGIWSPKYRLFTGTFTKEAAEAAAEQLRKATGWTVYVVEA